MKLFYIKTAISGILMMVSIMAIDCKNPDEYKPKGDSLIPPPPPPQLLTPPDSFVHMPFAGGSRLYISWEPLADAESYEIKFIPEKHQEWTISLDTNFLIQSWADTSLFDRYQWQVRAYSTKWEYYTAWSSPHHFEVSSRFAPPTPIFPPRDTVLYFDSLPTIITFQWSEVSGAQYYYLRLYEDTTFLFEIRVTANAEAVEIGKAGGYFWQVLAGSKHWEYDTGWSPLVRFLVSVK
ncbi:MAG: hypothetical protein ABIL39_07390 [candidate division WOR-3 bacterium]